MLLQCEILRSLYVYMCESEESFQSSLCKYAFAPDDLQGLACLYLPCRSARPPSMTPCSPGSALSQIKRPWWFLSDNILVRLPSPLSPASSHCWPEPCTHCSLWPFGLSSSYHRWWPGHDKAGPASGEKKGAVCSSKPPQLHNLNTYEAVKRLSQLCACASVFYTLAKGTSDISLTMQIILIINVFWLVHYRSV